MTDLPQWAMEKAEIVAKEATRDAMKDPLMPYFVTVSPHIARALVEAKDQGAQEKAAEIAALLKDPAAVRVNYLRGDIACQALIDEARQDGRREALEEAARVVEAYPPDAFFDVLYARTHRETDADYNWIMEGDTGAWAAHMSAILAPYSAAIRKLMETTNEQ